MHIPVMAEETVELLAPRKGGIYVDGTVGGGGHARAILASLDGDVTLIGIDRDNEALSCAGAVLKQWAGKINLIHGNFADMKTLLEKAGVGAVNGILLDLGMSSMQVNRAERGFSFMKDGPLDMRMDTGQKTSAADIVEKTSENELAGIICRYGEEPAGRRIARAIVIERRRKGEWTTLRLAQTVEKVSGRRGRIHPATRTFQAMRIAVNDELRNLENGLETGISILAAEGRMVVISYHSLEDRIVKQSFKRHVGQWVSLPEGGRRWEGAKPLVKNILKNPRQASAEEILLNPRARSAKMRCIERAD
jgi:16S rRNA (cytosine1402-N4)-methyltransferase